MYFTLIQRYIINLSNLIQKIAEIVRKSLKYACLITFLVPFLSTISHFQLKILYRYDEMSQNFRINTFEKTES